MTISELAQYINKRGVVLTGLGSIIIPVIVRDVRQIFGRTDLLISPYQGEGEAWVDVNKVNLERGS